MVIYETTRLAGWLVGWLVGWLRHCATSRKVARSMVSLKFFIDIILPAVLVLGLTQPLTEMSTRNISWGWRWPVRTADNLTTFMCRLSWHLGASTSWNPQGLSRPVMGLLLHGVSIQNSTVLTSRRLSSNLRPDIVIVLRSFTRYLHRLVHRFPDVRPFMCKYVALCDWVT